MVEDNDGESAIRSWLNEPGRRSRILEGLFVTVVGGLIVLVVWDYASKTSDVPNAPTPSLGASAIAYASPTDVITPVPPSSPGGSEASCAFGEEIGRAHV